MSRRDVHHQAVVRALEKDHWRITDDPLTLEFAGKLVGIDLAAEKLLAAERNGRAIAVEIKSFQGSSDVSEFHTALGQFLNYRYVLAKTMPERTLYLAVPQEAFWIFPRDRCARDSQGASSKASDLRLADGGDCSVDRVAEYQEIVRKVVEQYAAAWKPRDGTHIDAVTDCEHAHYQIVRSGWKEGRYVHSCLVHFVVRGNEIHLLKNDTDVEWDRELADRGVPASDIILTFRHPSPGRAATATT